MRTSTPGKRNLISHLKGKRRHGPSSFEDKERREDSTTKKKILPEESNNVDAVNSPLQMKRISPEELMPLIQGDDVKKFGL